MTTVFGSRNQRGESGQIHGGTALPPFESKGAHPEQHVWALGGAFSPAIALVLGLAACSSTSPNPTPSSNATKVSGAVVDAFVINATITAYEVNSLGQKEMCVPATPATTPSTCATATSDNNGNYTINLGSYSGAVLLESTGGSYTDTVTGQTQPVPAGVILSSFLPSVTANSGPQTAQLTALTTIAANLALENMAQGVSAASAASAANTLVQNYFGVQNLDTTALLDLTNANCGGATTTQENFDASLIFAGIAQLAQQYGVSTIDLTNAIILDFSSNAGVPTGLLAGGSSITIGNTTINLAQIEGTSLGQSLETAIQAFVASAKNVCKAPQSAGQAGGLSGLPPPPPPCTSASAFYCYSAVIDYTGPAGVFLAMQISLTCGDDIYSGQHVFRAGGRAPGSGALTNVSFNIDATAPQSGSYAGSPNYDYANDCGGNKGIMELEPNLIQGVNCTFSPSTTAFISLASNGNQNNSLGPIVVDCTPATYTVDGTVSGLPAGAGITIGDSVNGDQVVVSANGSFTLPAQLGLGASYTVTVLSSTGLPAGEQCTVAYGTGTISGLGTNVLVTCAPVAPPAKLNGQNGLAFENGQLYVANYGNNQVLVFNEAGTASSPTLSLSAVITPSAGSGLVAPTRLAFDASGRYLFVTWGHQGSQGYVAVYDTQASNAQIALISDSHIYGPLGVAVDTAGNVYVAENSGNSITVFTPNSSTDPSMGYTFSLNLTSDYAGHTFPAPGALAFFVDPLNGHGYLLVGLSTGNVLAYETPLTQMSTPAGGSTCTGGVTAIALSLASEQLYVSYYYGALADGYALSSILGTGCPTPADTATGLYSPEGLAVDGNQNVIVSNSGTSQLAIYPATLGTSLYTYGP